MRHYPQAKHNVRVARRPSDGDMPQAIVEEAEQRGTEIIVIGSPRQALTRAQRAVFGRTVDYVPHHARCRAMVTATRFSNGSFASGISGASGIRRV